MNQVIYPLLLIVAFCFGTTLAFGFARYGWLLGNAIGFFASGILFLFFGFIALSIPSIEITGQVVEIKKKVRGEPELIIQTGSRKYYSARLVKPNEKQPELGSRVTYLVSIFGNRAIILKDGKTN